MNEQEGFKWTQQTCHVHIECIFIQIEAGKKQKERETSISKPATFIYTLSTQVFFSIHVLSFRLESDSTLSSKTET